MEKILLRVETNKKLCNILLIGSMIILGISSFLLFSTLMQESTSYLTYLQETKRNEDLILSLIMLLCGLYSLYIGANFASMSICICENKVYISTGMKQSSKYEFSYSEILSVSKKGYSLNIQTVNSTLSLYHIEQSDRVIKLLQDKINKR